MGFWHVVKHDLYELVLPVDNPEWVVWNCDSLSWSSKVCVVLSAPNPCPVHASLSGSHEYSEDMTDVFPSAGMLDSKKTVVNLVFESSPVSDS